MKKKVVCCLAVVAGLIFLLWHSTRTWRDPSSIRESDGARMGTDSTVPAPEPLAAKSAAASPVASPSSPDAVSLPLRQDVLWQKPAPEPAFAAFQEWVRRYEAAASPQAKAALETEGIELARTRRRAL